MGYLKKIDSFFCKIQEYICILSGVFIAVTIICAAFMRYILKMNFGGSEELILFATLWEAPWLFGKIPILPRI